MASNTTHQSGYDRMNSGVTHTSGSSSAFAEYDAEKAESRRQLLATMRKNARTGPEPETIPEGIVFNKCELY